MPSPWPVRRGGCAVAALAALPAAAGAHAIVLPAQSRPADRQIYRLIVPSERNVDTVAVWMAVPTSAALAITLRARAAPRRR